MESTFDNSEKESFKYEYVELENGNIPFIKFLDSLSIIEKAEIIAAIDELLNWLNKNEIPPQNISKHLMNGIFELRVKHFNRITRSFYFYSIGKIIIFTHGFIKKTNKIDRKEIEKAIRYKNIYLKRIHNEN
ncbi:MAG: hypothetical protein A2X61_10095 [Ignavibacteria bacterium GWB2_35_12]|nr:MAG: hypothetical protein A2X63_06380 [Ignavibacteria bacterium GWA2_35_8]OGU39700.1 MAG: hypothetical protein A2X61_10095 [Ignavibacteria bacterium GWB2_35_12]OGU93155.1 MAG: hypothetical protein A2220_09160 [Ignavibacteria bacterium RIFOXYA2_FULL_35_10]OGV23895.1 MAG: hypothetical protein A2475_07285 [Ignavibacteria bacterium RIFOXYC2_FULL_35_21]